MEKLMFLESQVSIITACWVILASNPAVTGEMNHDAMILIILSQLTPSMPTVASPAPRREPTTVWVPEIGIPNNELIRRNRKEVAHTENIIVFCSCSSSSLVPGMILVDRVAATFFEQNIAPMKIVIPPMKMR